MLEKTEKISKKILSILPTHFVSKGIYKQGDSFLLDLNCSTPAGEDWWETIWFDGTMMGFVDALRERADCFDVDEEAAPYIEARGKNGIPYSISEILEDARWKQNEINKLAELFEEKSIFENYELFIRAVDTLSLNGEDRFTLIVDEEDFGVYKDRESSRFFYVEQGENDASEFFELELIAHLDFSTKHDIYIIKEKYGRNILPEFFPDAICCGEYKNGERLSYLWFKEKEDTNV